MTKQMRHACLHGGRCGIALGPEELSVARRPRVRGAAEESAPGGQGGELWRCQALPGTASRHSQQALPRRRFGRRRVRAGGHHEALVAGALSCRGPRLAGGVAVAARRRFALEARPIICRKQAGSGCGQVALRRLVSAPDQASGCSKLRDKPRRLDRCGRPRSPHHVSTWSKTLGTPFA